MYLRYPICSYALLGSISLTAAGAGLRTLRDQTHPAVRLPEPANVTFQGILRGGVESFLNIRFGVETSGGNRFAPPTPFRYRSDSVVNASVAGAACPQAKVPDPGLPFFDNVTDISEDCLTLRVDRPTGTGARARLPVMVYVYGGGDTFGQIYDSAYDPTSLVASAAAKANPVIYVAMNYRLGIFGFAASPALAAADSLNAGLLDQRLALKWVQEHISAFGGDPSRVTIFGESDGATGVGLQITAYGGQVNPPFARAIMQSGGPTADPGTVGNFSTFHTAEVTRLANCTTATTTSEQDLACLRALPMSTLLDVAYRYMTSINPVGSDIFIPTAPSSFIPDSPSRLLSTGRFARDIDLISGWNEDDGSFFVSPAINSSADVANTFQGRPPALTNASTQQSLALYPVADFQSSATDNISAQYFRASRIERDSEYACASLLMVQANLKFSRRGTANFLYSLNQTLLTTFFEEHGISFLGVSHGSDVPFVFNQASTRFASVATTSDRTLASRMSGSWASFATCGSPTGRNGTLSNWSPCDDQRLNVRIIGGPDAGLRDVDKYQDLIRRCAFWNSPQINQEQEV